MTGTIHLGYEVGTGEPIAVPINHLCVTGQTQMSGKTTTLEALISRSKLKAIVFVTKRGEGAFNTKVQAAWPTVEWAIKRREIPPFFKNQTGWVFVSQILGAVLNEKLKFERYWITKISRGAKSLSDVLHNAQKWLAETKKAQDEQVLTMIVEYFNLFMPELERLPYTSELKLQEALNVMDLSSYSLPLQMLVISAVVEEVYKNHEGVVVVIPEAWEFIPEGKSSPVKASVIKLIRKGGSLKNFVWLDSQDIAGVEKEVIRQIPVWILGVQREQNEVARTLKHIPGNVKKPRADDIMQLSRGHFITCFDKSVHTVYVQPVWMEKGAAYSVAMGETIGIKTIDPRVANGDVIVSEFDGEVTAASRLPRIDARFVSRSSDGIRDQFEGESGFDDTLLRTNFMKQIRDRIDEPHDHDRVTNSVADSIENKEREKMDQKERDEYETTIGSLREEIAELRQQLNLRRLPDQAKQTPAGPEGEDIDVLAARGPGASGASAHRALSTVQNLMSSPPALDVLARALIRYLPSNGRVIIEAREVVLREFQQQEVERILAMVADYSVFQRCVLRFLHAKGSNASKAEIFRAVRGKEPNMLSGTERKEKDEEIAQLVTAGFIRKDSAGRHFPEISKLIAARLASYTPSDQDIEDVLGQILLKLK